MLAERDLQQLSCLAPAESKFNYISLLKVVSSRVVSVCREGGCDLSGKPGTTPDCLHVFFFLTCSYNSYITNTEHHITPQSLTIKQFCLGFFDGFLFVITSLSLYIYIITNNLTEFVSCSCKPNINHRITELENHRMV